MFTSSINVYKLIIYPNGNFLITVSRKINEFCVICICDSFKDKIAPECIEQNGYILMGLRMN